MHRSRRSLEDERNEAPDASIPLGGRGGVRSQRAQNAVSSICQIPKEYRVLGTEEDLGWKSMKAGHKQHQPASGEGCRGRTRACRSNVPEGWSEGWWGAWGLERMGRHGVP